MTESPFATYRAILVDGENSAAGFLQAFAMAMYAGAANPLDAAGLRNLDAQNLKAFLDMATWFHQHGENDPDFVDVCKQIREKRKAYGRRIKAHLDMILAGDPDKFDGGRDEHASSVRFYRREHQSNIDRGWADKD